MGAGTGAPRLQGHRQGTRTVRNRAVRTDAEMLLRVPDTEADRIAALRATFDDPAVTLVEVYAAGDGGAYSGLMVVGRRTNGEATFLVFLMDQHPVCCTVLPP